MHALPSPPVAPGTYLDPEDVSSATVGALDDGREAYFYELNAPYAKDGNRCLAVFTVKVGRRGMVVGDRGGVGPPGRAQRGSGRQDGVAGQPNRLAPH